MAVSRTLCIALAILIALTAAAAEPSPAERSSATPVVLIALNGGRATVGAGTVVVLQPLRALVLTAEHVAAAGDLYVRFAGATAVPARIIREFPEQDLALVEAPLDPGAILPRVQAAVAARPALGEPVTVWGAGDDFEPALERGSVLDTAPAFPDSVSGTFAIACAACRHGDSGAGIYDADGELLGVLVAVWTSRDGHARAFEAQSVPLSLMPETR